MKRIITGGAGFIGCNAAARYLAQGDHVVVVDDLSRKGSEKNLAWLESQAGARAGRLAVARVDVRRAEDVRAAFQEHRDAQVVLHLAGQVAVTTSVTNPRDDFERNALGTFNVLEAARPLHDGGSLRAFLFASTNKVYGGMEDVSIVERDGHYAYGTLPNGVPETQPLDFHSPYGCSKGAADQYTVDYARIYGLPTVTFRQSAIYGPRQMGVEDQGWLAWFCIAGVLGRPIAVYGDGMQVRDLLYVDDLVDAYDAAVARIDRVAGGVFNVGGGPGNVMSIIEGVRFVERRLGRSVNPRFEEWRPGDQRVFIADISKAARELDWRPKTSLAEGTGRLFTWVQENQDLFT